MNCINHENVEAVFKCKDCEKSICKDCAVNNNGEVVCLQCAKERGLIVIKNDGMNTNINHDGSYNQYRDKRRVSTFLTTVLSFLPGAGHMYLGLMRRGLQIMIAFFGIIALGSVLYYNNGIFSALATVIWFFSVFECFHLRRNIQRGEELREDLFLDISNKKINLYYIGIGFLVIGGMMLLDVTLYRLFNIFNINRQEIYYSIAQLIRSLIFPAALIFGGIWLLNKHKKNAQV